MRPEKQVEDALADLGAAARATHALGRYIDGLRNSEAKYKRKTERLAQAIGDLVAKSGQMKSEVKRLEDLLVFIYKRQLREADAVPGAEEICEAIRGAIPHRIASVTSHTDAETPR